MAAWKVYGQVEHISERDTARESNTYDAGFMQMDFKTGNMPLCFRM